jgi:hypothetical protein
MMRWRTILLSSTTRAMALATTLIAPFFWLAYRSPGVLEGGLWLSGRTWLQTSVFTEASAYPPGIPLIFALLETLFGAFSSRSVLFVHAALFLFGATLWYRVLRYWLEVPRVRWAAFVFSLANPYFLWLALTSKDTVFEWIVTISFLLSLTIIVKSGAIKRVNLAYFGALLATFGCGLLFRVALVPVLLGILLAACWFVPLYRRQLGISALGCLVLAAGFIGYQQKVYGYTGFSSTFGYNVYLGQHPLYEYAHPQHDIDVCLAPVVAEVVPDPYSTAGDRRLRELAFAEIKKDPVRFMGISLRKTIWHWLNFEKIPNLSANSVVLRQEGGMMEVSTVSIRSLPSLLYSLYKIIYIPAFILALFFWISRRLWRDPAGLFLIPLLALWPIVVLTFPDTRFKIVAEVVAVLFIGSIFMRTSKETSHTLLSGK